MNADPAILEDRVQVARLVAGHWITAAMNAPEEAAVMRLIAHPLALVLRALDGETDPDQLAVSDNPDTVAALTAITQTGGAR